MTQNNEFEKIIIWGKEWIHSIEPLENNPYSETGCLLDIFFNSDIGKIALLYIRPDELYIDFGLYNNLFEEIHEKWLDDVPYILFDDIKYKEICSDWNNSSSTICNKNDFENIIKNR